jgi:uncharacterized protein (TIGR02722 family)
MQKSVTSGMLIAVCASVLMAGCASTTQQTTTPSVPPPSPDLSATDIKVICSKMVDSMLTFPPIVEATSQRRPILALGSIKNRTTRWVDLKAVTDTITAKLIQSGRFRFIDRSTDNEVIDELKTQQDGGLTNPNKAKQFGKQEAAEFILTGDVTSIPQQVNGMQGVSFRFTLSLRNLQTGIVEWKDEQDVGMGIQ